jgi:hypothetical protein
MSNEDELIRREAARQGLAETTYRMLRVAGTREVQDIVNDLRSGPAQPSSMIPENNRLGPAQRGTGWQKERPIQPPDGLNLIDQMCENQSALERIRTAHERAKVTLDLKAYQVQQEQEREARRRLRELDPVNSGLYKSKAELDRGE